MYFYTIIISVVACALVLISPCNAACCCCCIVMWHAYGSRCKLTMASSSLLWRITSDNARKTREPIAKMEVASFLPPFNFLIYLWYDRCMETLSSVISNWGCIYRMDQYFYCMPHIGWNHRRGRPVARCMVAGRAYILLFFKMIKDQFNRPIDAVFLILLN